MFTSPSIPVHIVVQFCFLGDLISKNTVTCFQFLQVAINQKRILSNDVGIDLPIDDQLVSSDRREQLMGVKYGPTGLGKQSGSGFYTRSTSDSPGVDTGHLINIKRSCEEGTVPSNQWIIPREIIPIHISQSGPNDPDPSQIGGASGSGIEFSLVARRASVARANWPR